MIYTATKQMLSTSIISGLFCLVVTASQPVYAQPSLQTEEAIFNEHFDNWYQVELIVFERIEKASEDSEMWPKNIALTYPPRLEYLIEEKVEETDTTGTENTASTDNSIDLNNSLALKGNGAAPETTDNRDLLETLQSADPQDPLNMKYRSAIEKSEKARMTPKEQPYIILDETLQDLNDDARRLARDRSMRVLFHQSWRQPMTKEDDAPSIVMTGGDVFGEHYELEGSIKLYVSRYLHLHTNLWLTQFEANVGQETEHWPLVPDRPQPLVIDLDLNSVFENSYSYQQESSFEEALKFNTQISATPSNFGFSYSPDDTPLPENELSYARTRAPSLMNDYSRLALKPFITKHIVTMKQKRRMRSKELHYLDHPKLGILINIKKYEPEFPKESEKDG